MRANSACVLVVLLFVTANAQIPDIGALSYSIGPLMTAGASPGCNPFHFSINCSRFS